MTDCATERLLTTQLFAAWLRGEAPARVDRFATDVLRQRAELDRDTDPASGTPEQKAIVSEAMQSLAAALILRTSD